MPGVDATTMQAGIAPRTAFVSTVAKVIKLQARRDITDELAVRETMGSDAAISSIAASHEVPRPKPAIKCRCWLLDAGPKSIGKH